jgi:pimeloyl-ACP methyl ester carboxylesterase
MRGAPAAKVAWPLVASQEDISKQAALIRGPTLVISGEQDRVDPPAVLEQELMTRIPHATLHILPGIGHLSPLEAPGKVSELIRAFATPLIAKKSLPAEQKEAPSVGMTSAVRASHSSGNKDFLITR